MLETYTAYKLEDLGNLTERQYKKLLSQTDNLRRYRLGEKLKLETEEDKIKRITKIAKQKLNG